MGRTAIEQKEVLQKFIKKWSGFHKEDEEARSFLIDLLQNIFEVQNTTDRISFEKKVRVNGNIKRIDAFIPETNTLIEMKSSSVNLDHTSSKDYGSAYQQAKSYYDNLPRYEKGRFILTSNFNTIEIYDMDHPGEEPDRILLENLEQEWHKLKILIDPSLSSREAKRIKREEDVSIRAGELVGELYRPLLAQLGPIPKSEQEKKIRTEQEKELNILIVRIVFCLFAEDSGLFQNGQFHDFLLSYNASNINQGLEELFKVLDTPEEDRETAYLSEALLNFPYVNGGLFKEKIRVPRFTSAILKNILESMSEEFNWSEISPTIFGAVFESTLNPETRRAGGMHYTSIKNIHKVIDPLFLDDLKAELEEIKASKQPNVRVRKAKEFQDKLASLKFLDPACGSGNFLTESFLCLRKLENEAIKIQLRDSPQVVMDTGFIKVTIEQFYGIEINDFAVSVAKTALYIAEAQMYEATQRLVTWNDNFLPLRSYTHIHEANALRIDWNSIVSAQELTYIIGNPPFLGYTQQNSKQRVDMEQVVVGCDEKRNRLAGKLDYVSGWYFKAAEYMGKNPKIQAAFVSTNSITQGEQVAPLWEPLIKRYGININFAYRTFIWESEAKNKAHVYCVIIGFSKTNKESKKIFTSKEIINVKHISPYLLATKDIFISSRSKELCFSPHLIKGNQPTDNGNLIIEDKETFLSLDPKSAPYIRELVGSAEYIKGKKRWCLWLVNVDPKDLNEMPEVMKRIKKCKEFRLKSTKLATRKSANTPYLFQEIRYVGSGLLIPRVSGERREYIPIGYLDENTVPLDSAVIAPKAELYHFGVLSSKVHMSWVRVVAGRLKSDYRYSIKIVYNNFPWPTPTDKQKAKIEQTAQAILDARDLYPNSSLADLYNPLTMPIELRKAHEANDKAVMAAYGFKLSLSESQIVAELMKMYQKLVENEK